MNNLKHFALMVLVALVSIVSAKAEDIRISLPNADGVTIYYYLTDRYSLNGVYQSGNFAFVTHDNNYVDVDPDPTKTDMQLQGGHYSGNIVIPSSIEYKGDTYPVVGVGEEAFYKCSDLISVYLPEPITIIEKGAFRGCTSLENVKFPNTLTFIGYEAFISCSSLRSIILPESLTSTGSSSFRGCTSLSEIILPESLTNIGFYSFKGCKSLKKIKLPQSLTSINTGAFEYCSSLEEIVIPDKINSLSDQIFYECTSLHKVILPSNLKTIGSYIFKGCSSLMQINIPSTVEEICSGAFENCSRLKEIDLPEGLQYIAAYLFHDCSSLKKVNIPSSIISIRYNAFSDCTSLNSITIPKNSSISFENYAFNGYNGLVYNLSDMKIESYSRVFTDKAELDGYVFGKKDNQWYFTEYIGDNDALILPDNFNGNHYEIYSNAKFKTFTVLDTGNGITELPKGIFWRNPNIKEVTLGKNIQSAGAGVFMGSNNIEILNYNIAHFENQNSDEVARYDEGYTHMTYKPFEFSSITTLNIGKDVEYIPNNMVQSNTHLTTVNFADGIKAQTIGERTFYNCSNLLSINLYEEPKEIVTAGEEENNGEEEGNEQTKEVLMTKGVCIRNIGSSAFYGCTGLQEINIENVETIGSSAFNGCTGLTELTLGKNLTSIGVGAFAGCYNLQTLNYNVVHFENQRADNYVIYKNENGYNGYTYYPLEFNSISTLNIGDEVEYIPNNIVEGNNNLTTVNLADGIKAQTIGRYTFSGCSNLQSINLYEEPKEIVTEGEEENNGEEEENEETKEVQMTKGVCIKNIGEYAFNGCSKLNNSLDLRGVETIGNYAFYSIQIPNLTLGKNLNSVADNAFYFNAPLEKLTVGNDYGLNYILGKEYYDYTDYRYKRVIKKLVIAEDFADEQISGSFTNQNNLETIESNTVEPLAFALVNPFTESQYSSIAVKVPEESAEKYKAAPVWKLFYVTSADCLLKLYNGNSEMQLIPQDGTERPEEATAVNAVMLVDEQLEAGNGLLTMGNVVYRDERNNWVAGEINLFDAQPFYNPVNVEAQTINYTRNFTSTNLQALYLPYAMSYDDWKDKAKVSYINDVHQFDDDDDGEIDRTVLEFISVKSGKLAPNIPYLIKPFEKGETTFTSSNKTLKATLSDGYIDCSSTRTLYTLKGTYQTRDDIYSNGYYAMSDGTFKVADNAGVKLSPFRIFLNISNRYGSGSVPRAKKITIIVDGIEEDTADIDGITINGATPTASHNLQGVRVGEGYKGIVIRNGRKVLAR